MKLFGLFCLVAMVTVILMEDLDGAVGAPFRDLKSEELYISPQKFPPPFPSFPKFSTIPPSTYDFLCDLPNAEENWKTLCLHRNPSISTTTTTTQPPQRELNRKQNENKPIYVNRKSLLGFRIRRWLKGEIHISGLFSPDSSEDLREVSAFDGALAYFAIVLLVFVLLCSCQCCWDIGLEFKSKCQNSDVNVPGERIPMGPA